MEGWRLERSEVKIFWRNLRSANTFQAKSLWENKLLWNILALENTLSSIMRSFHISILPSTTFFALFFLSFFRP